MSAKESPRKESRASANVLLDRELPEGYLQDWTEILSREKESVDKGDFRSVVIFRLDEEWFALSTSLFKQIQQLKPVHSLPLHHSGVLKGLVNVRGRLEVCADLHALFELSPKFTRENAANVTLYPRMAVLEIQGRTWVIIADEIHGIHYLHAADVQNSPVSVLKSGANFLSGMFQWEGRRVGVIDEERMMAAFRRSIA